MRASTPLGASTSSPGDEAAASAHQVFIEINPFHAETLFFYHADLSSPSGDPIFGHERLFGQELFDEIPAPKQKLSVYRLLRFLRQQQIRRCHFNTINLTLTPITWETTRLNLLTLFLPLASRALGCRNGAIMHEADQFFSTGIDSYRRQAWFRRVIGRWFIRLFDEIYVIAPEVAEYLEARQIHVKVLDSRPLTTFLPPDNSDAKNDGTIQLVWIGPIVSFRRDWQALLELKPDRLASLGVSIVMVCDSRVGDGPALKAALEGTPLAERFVFMDHRPTDRELFSWVRSSAGVLCLYGGPEYGRTKTSGARHIAAAFRKPYIGTNPSLAVYDYDGSPMVACTTLTGCIEEMVRFASTNQRPKAIESTASSHVHE